MLVAIQLTVVIDFKRRKKKSMEINGYCQSGCTNIFQNIFFCVQKKIETHTGLEQHEVE